MEEQKLFVFSRQLIGMTQNRSEMAEKHREMDRNLFVMSDLPFEAHDLPFVFCFSRSRLKAGSSVAGAGLLRPANSGNGMQVNHHFNQTRACRL